MTAASVEEEEVMDLFTFLDELRAKTDYPGAFIEIRHQHIPDPRIMPDGAYTEDDPKPTEDDRGDELRWDVDVRQFGDNTRERRTSFAVITRKDLTVVDVEVEGPKADYQRAAWDVAQKVAS